MIKTIVDRCPYCGKDVDVKVSVEVSETACMGGSVDATIHQRSYASGKDLLRENTESRKGSPCPPNMPKVRR